jgi:hypothetical protein
LRHRNAAGRRDGLATLEFAMVLPFLAALAAITFTMAAASLARSAAILDARQQAWHKLHGGRSEGALNLPGVSLQAWWNQNGVVSGSGTKSRTVHQLGGGSRLVSLATAKADARHEVFSNPWDNGTFPFSPQPPLTFSESLLRNLGLWKAGGSFDGRLRLWSDVLAALQAPAGAAALGEKAKQFLSGIADRLNELGRQVEAAQNRLKDLKDKLALAEDADEIKALREAIRKAEKVLEKLQDARDRLGQGQGTLPD